MTRGSFRSIHPVSGQRGVVLLVCLILLLVITFIGYSVMETSSMESKMVAVKLAKEQSFQAAESLIQQSLSTSDMVNKSYSQHLVNGASISEDASAEIDSDLSGELEVRYIGDAPPVNEQFNLGDDAVVNQFYEVTARVVRGADQFEARHVQGVKRLVPSGN